MPDRGTPTELRDRHGEPTQQQIALVTWPCPTCLGARSQLGADGLATCRVCQGTGRVDHDPNDVSTIPY
jgi:DnaJ-class molecular chaperone